LNRDIYRHRDSGLASDPRLFLRVAKTNNQKMVGVESQKRGGGVDEESDSVKWSHQKQ